MTEETRTLYHVEFKCACQACGRQGLDALSLRVVGERRGEPGIRVSRHLRPRKVGESRGMCAGSLSMVVRTGTDVAPSGARSSSGAGSTSKNRAK